MKTIDLTKQMVLENRRIFAVKVFGLNLEKNFFELDTRELAAVIGLMHSVGYKSNYAKTVSGKSQPRAFWDYLKRGR